MLKQTLRTLKIILGLGALLLICGCNPPAADPRLDPTVYDWKFYLDANPDLPAAGIITSDQAQNHWLAHGVSEGRRAAPGFSSRDYLAKYADLRQAYGATNYLQAIQHWVSRGKGEGRVGVTECPSSFIFADNRCYGTALNAWVTSTYQLYQGYVFNIPLPPGGLDLTGLAGSVSIHTKGTNPSEALYIVGYSPGGNCLSNGYNSSDLGAIFQALSDKVVLGAFITKNLGGTPDEVSTDVNFGRPVHVTGCMFVIADGGPSLWNLAPITSLYMQTGIGLRLATQAPAPNPFTVGSGDEFIYGWDSDGPGKTTKQGVDFYFANRIPQNGTLVDLHGNVNAGAITAPTGPWNTVNGYYLDKGCQHVQPETMVGPGNFFDGLAPQMVPLHQFTQQGSDTVLQETVSQQLNVPVQAGDCLVHIVRVNGNSKMDAENQVRALVQPD